MRRRFERYLDKVFRWEELTVLMSEGRQHPRHPWSKVFQALFLGAACQMRSLREIELACRSGCLKRRVEVSEDGKRRWRWQYYHRVVLAVVVSGPFPLPLALRFQQPGESEVACAAALLEELVRYLGRRYFDIVVADALYLDCHFKHATAHQDPALVVWTMIRLLAYTLTLLFYCRQVLSHRGHNTPPSLRAFAQSLRGTLPGLDTS